MLINTHKTLFPYIFSQGKGQYVLGVSLHSSETAGKHVCEPWNWSQMAEEIFSPVTAGYLQ